MMGRIRKLFGRAPQRNGEEHAIEERYKAALRSLRQVTVDLRREEGGTFEDLDQRVTETDDLMREAFGKP